MLRTRGAKGKKLGAGAFDMDAAGQGKVSSSSRWRAPSSARQDRQGVLVVRHEDGTTQRAKVRLKR